MVGSAVGKTHVSELWVILESVELLVQPYNFGLRRGKLLWNAFPDLYIGSNRHGSGIHEGRQSGCKMSSLPGKISDNSDVRQREIFRPNTLVEVEPAFSCALCGTFDKFIYRNRFLDAAMQRHFTVLVSEPNLVRIRFPRRHEYVVSSRGRRRQQESERKKDSQTGKHL